MTKKKIKILTTGAIRVKGFINGPVLTPYMEDTTTIFAMVSQGIKVVEVCNDGSEVVLTTSNFADDNNKKVIEAKVVKAEESIPETKDEVKEELTEEVETEVTEPVVEEKNEEVVETEVVSEVKEEAEPVKVQEPKPSYQNNYKNNNYNKHNKQNKNNNYKK